MAIQRNRRQRKKMHLAEFQELGFSELAISRRYPD